MITWPENLIEELAYKRALLVLGSGVSATSQNDKGLRPKTWSKFLEDAKTLMENKNCEVNFVDKMIAEKNYLMALQTIYADCDSGVYSDFLKKEFTRPKFQPSLVHQARKEIDSKIVISTNFDKIYDNLSAEDGFVICDHKDTQKIVSNIKSPENVIIKAHGSIDDVNSIIFTGEQYYNSKRKYSEFYKLLEALFLTHTVIFLGYSLSDPDINLILENIINSSSETNPHYVVVKEGIPKQIREHWKRTYNISCLEYGPFYDNFEENILELKNQVLSLKESRRIP